MDVKFWLTFFERLSDFVNTLYTQNRFYIYESTRTNRNLDGFTI
jgi:hypothetical protein